MMISEEYHETVFIADFSDYANRPDTEVVEHRGVVVGMKENGIIPSFIVRNENGFPFRVVNNEHNPAVFMRTDGTKVSQCECEVYSERNDNRRGWLLFLELKYCKAKNLYHNMLDGIVQLKASYKYLIGEKQEFDANRFKKYLVISTPGVTPLDPFDAFYFNQDEILSIKEETGCLLKASNEVRILTPALVSF